MTPSLCEDVPNDESKEELCATADTVRSTAGVASSGAPRPWERVAPGEWWATSPRQLTGTPYVYHGYVTRDRKRAERLCHDGGHRTPEAAQKCAERTARRLNRG